jgi:hypothetical protein
VDNYLDKEHIRICGKAVEDFVNSETTDAACLSLIPKIRKVFNFSMDFEKKAEENFPYLNNILDSLNDKQKALVELNFDVWTFDSFVKDFRMSIGSKGGYPDRDIWEPLMEKIFDLEKNRDYDDKIIVRIDEILINIEKSQPKFKNTPFNWKNYLSEFCEQLITHKKTSILFRECSKNFSEIEEENFKKVLNNESVPAHHDIYHSQQVFKIVINRFINGISLNEYEPFENIIASYDRKFSAHHVYDKNCNLIKYKHPSLSENDFLQSPPDHLKKHSYEKFKNVLEKRFIEIRQEIIYPPVKEEFEAAHNILKRFCLEDYNVASYYFFVEFLKIENNYKLFNVCDNCGKYFISSSKRKQRFCSGGKCRQNYHNRRRIESGEAKEYKRKKRKEGAKESYYG